MFGDFWITYFWLAYEKSWVYAIISIGAFAGCLSWYDLHGWLGIKNQLSICPSVARPLTLELFSATVEATSIKLWVMIKFYPFISPSVTLTLFQGHRNTGKVNLKVIFFSPIMFWSSCVQICGVAVTCMDRSCTKCFGWSRHIEGIYLMHFQCAACHEFIFIFTSNRRRTMLVLFWDTIFFKHCAWWQHPLSVTLKMWHSYQTVDDVELLLRSQQHQKGISESCIFLVIFDLMEFKLWMIVTYLLMNLASNQGR